MNLCDTGPLVALGNRNDPDHTACLAAAAALPRGPLLTTWACFTEAMYLAGRIGGNTEQVKLWRLHDLGRLVLHEPTPAEVDRMAELMHK